MTKNILIVKGGFSDEAEISRMSAISVQKVLKYKGYKTKLIEPGKNFIPYLIKNKKRIDLIFNALHGAWGEDGKIQGLFEYLKIPYTHSGVTSSALGMNKFLSKKIFLHSNIKSPRGKIITEESLFKKDPYTRPFIIKPVEEGSSLGIHLIKKNTNLKNILDKDNLKEYLVEEYIAGIDITVGIMNGKAIGMLEVIPSNEIYGYDDKYKSKKTKYVIPKNIGTKLKKEIIKKSEKSYDLIGCNGIARVDFRVNKKNIAYVLEINTQPGLTRTSLFPKIAGNAGIDFPDLIEFIINDAGVNK